MVPSLQQLITPTEKFLRKVILYPDPENLAIRSHFTVIDFMRQTLPVSWETVTVLFYPEPDDVVIGACADGANYISFTKSVQERHKNSETLLLF